MRRRSVSILALVSLAALCLTACGHRGQVSRGYSEGQNPEGDDVESYSSDIEFGSAVEMRFRDTEEHLREGRFHEAMRSAQTLFRDHGLDRERRAQALLLWAQAEGNALNPERDVSGAIARVELLLEEFDGTDAAGEGERTLDRLRRYQKENGN
jgi:hypothetical protein